MLIMMHAAALAMGGHHRWLHEYAERQQAISNAYSALLANLEPNDAPKKPSIPMAWSAAVHAATLINGVTQESIVPLGTQFQVENTPLSRMATASTFKFGYVPAAFVGTPLEWMNITTYLTKSVFGLWLNGETLDGSKAYPTNKFNPTFGWLSGAKDGGMRPHNGSSYQSWVLSMSFPVKASFLLLVDAGGVPVYNEANYSIGVSYTMKTTFFEFRRNTSLVPNVWEGFDEDEYRKPAPCKKPADPRPKNTTIYIFHPMHNFNISSQDTGDATGDVFFVCVDFLTGKPGGIDHHYEWLSSWTVTHNPQMGQYQNCNGYPPKCIGANDYLVGHEAAQGLGQPAGGQCVDNPQTGEWWSLPEGGRCKGGATPAGGACTWSARREKTIDAKCLLDQLGFKQACARGKRAPFAEATKIFLGAFAADDPKHGGCPPLNASVDSW